MATFDAIPAAGAEEEISMSQVCGYLDGPVEEKGVVYCPAGVTGNLLVVQIVQPSSYCMTLTPEQASGCFLTLCEVVVESGAYCNQRTERTARMADSKVLSINYDIRLYSLIYYDIIMT